jgi:copper transport protein
VAAVGVRGLRLLLLGTLLWALLPAAPASAHAALLQSTPQDGVVLDQAPEEVALRFNQPVGIGLGAVKVVGPDGERVDDGAPELLENSHIVTVDVPDAGARGTYVLLWRVMSQDGHAVSGASTFSIGERSEPATAADAEDTGASPAMRVSRLLGFVGILVLIGAVVVPLLVWPAGLALRRVRGLMAAGLAAATIGSVGTLLAQGPQAAGLPLTDALGLLPEVLGTRYGIAHLARLALLAALAVTLVLLLRHGRRPRRAAGALLAAIGLPLLATWSLTGHPAAGSWTAIAIPADALHLLAVGTWVGGLTVLVVALLPRRDTAELSTALTGWSRLAVIAVAAMVATGLFAGWREVRALDALQGTTYGRLLLLKALLVVVMLVLGSLGRHMVRGHYGLGPTVVHAMGATAVHDPVATAPADTARRGLRRSTAIEAGIALAVVLVTTVLVDTAPAASEYARPLSTVTKVSDELSVQLDLDSARVGPNTLHIYLTGEGSKAIDVPEVTARITRDGETVPVQIRHVSLGHYEATEQLVVPYRGDWTLEVVVRTSDIAASTVRQPLTIR